MRMCITCASTKSLWFLLFVLTNLRDVSSCFCPHVWEPVCATDNNLYSNMCFFMCARINIPTLMVQDMTPCQGPVDPNAPVQENEGNGVSPNFWGPSAASSVSAPVFEPDPTFNSNPNPYVPYVPVCNWSCRKTSATAPIRICDEIGGLYTSDCDFYKAVCRAELRGYLLRRTQCTRNVNTIRRRKVNWV